MLGNKARVYADTNTNDDDNRQQERGRFFRQSQDSNSIKSQTGDGVNMNRFGSSRNISSLKLDDDHSNSDDEEANNLVAQFTIEKLRMYVKKIFVTSRFGTIYDMALLILSFVSAAQLIFQTTLPPESEQSAYQKVLADSFTILEMILAVLFGFDWLLALFLAEVKSEFFLSFFSMVDLVTVIPIWFTHSAALKYQDELYTNHDYFIYVLNALSNFRICRMFRLRKFIILMENAVERLLSEIILTGVVSLLFVAAMMQFLERQEDHIGAGTLDKDDYFNWFYFALITIFTVGYGDLYPLNRYGQLMTVIFIMIAVLLVPKMTNDLAEEIRATSPYSRLVYRKKGPKSRHVLICGDLTTTQMFELFAELFHEDHRDELSMTCVVLQPRPPTKDMFGLLNHPLYGLSLQYLEGSPLNTKDLVRAKAWDALAVFIMCNKFSTAADEEDARVILQHTHIQRFVSSYNYSYRPQFFLQLIRPENRQHLSSSSSTTRNFGQEYKEVIVGISELKMGIMAKSVLNPGISALICNLISSFSELDEEDEEDEEDEDESGEIRDKVQQMTLENWISEYSMGCDWEIYSTKLSRIFTGNTFSSVAHSIYSKLGIVLMGLKLTQKDSKYTSARPKILLNPHDLVIPSQDEYDILGFVIARNQETADLQFSSDHGQNQLSVLSAGIRNIIQPITGDQSPDRGEDKQYRNILKMYKHLGMNLSDAYSEQERIQSQKDQYIQSNYYCRDDKTSGTLISNTVYGYVTIDIPTINGHTIITGRHLTNLKDLITPLRRVSDGSLNYIVVLSPDNIPPDTWRSISHLEAILYVRGSSLEEKDLRRAGIYRASKIVILANPTYMQEESVNSHGGNSSVDQGLVDVDAIFSYQLIQRINPSANLIMEVVKEENIAYLDNDTSELAVKDYKFSSAFAAGILFTPTLLDTMLVQSFYNQDMISLVSAMVDITEDDYSSMNNTTSSNNKNNNNSNTKNINSYKSQSLYLAPIPDGIDQNRSYGTAFEKFISKGMLPLGLLRGVGRFNKFGVKGNKMEYVVANPPGDTELFGCDRIYVLSSKPPLSSSKIVKDGRKEMKRMEEARKSKQKSKQSTLNFNHDGDMGALRSRHNEMQRELSTTIDELKTNHANAKELIAKGTQQISKASTLMTLARAKHN